MTFTCIYLKVLIVKRSLCYTWKAKLEFSKETLCNSILNKSFAKQKYLKLKKSCFRYKYQISDVLCHLQNVDQKYGIWFWTYLAWMWMTNGRCGTRVLIMVVSVEETSSSTGSIGQLTPALVRSRRTPVHLWRQHSFSVHHGSSNL